LIEIAQRRTLTSKIFQDGNLFHGNFHIGHIHYPSGLSKDGSLSDIDTTLQYNSTSKLFSTTKASYDAEVGLFGDVRFHNVSGSLAVTIPNLSKIEGVPYSGSAFGLLGKGLIWKDLLGTGMHQIVEARNGSLTRIFRFEQKPSFNEIDMTVDLTNATFATKPKAGKDLIVSDQLVFPTSTAGKNIYLRKPHVWNHRGEVVDVSFKFYLASGVLHVVKIIPQAFIDLTFTELGAWLETDDSNSYYADAGGDGSASKWHSDWSTARGANTAAAVAAGGSTQIQRVWVNAGEYNIDRMFFPFDTSGIGAGATVTAATFKLMRWLSSGTRTYAIIQTTQASITALVVGDYDNLTLNSPPEGATRKAIVDLAADGTYNDFALNATGLGWIIVDGSTKLGVREGSKDVDNSAPTDDGYVYWYCSNQTGTDKDPRLDVTWTAGGGTLEALVSSMWTVSNVVNISSVGKGFSKSSFSNSNNENDPSISRNIILSSNELSNQIDNLSIGKNCITFFNNLSNQINDISIGKGLIEFAKNISEFLLNPTVGKGQSILFNAVSDVYSSMSVGKSFSSHIKSIENLILVLQTEAGVIPGIFDISLITQYRDFLVSTQKKDLVGTFRSVDWTTRI